MNDEQPLRLSPPTAHEVFMSFVQQLSNGEVNCNNIFSVACFQKFLSTRKGSIKHPEQTFHRTVVTHVRGIDKRRPFPPEIEAEILRLLRNEEFNIWDNCFPGGNDFHIGRHGFRHTGYHEKLALDGKAEGHSSEVIEAVLHIQESQHSSVSSFRKHDMSDILDGISIETGSTDSSSKKRSRVDNHEPFRALFPCGEPVRSLPTLRPNGSKEEILDDLNGDLLVAENTENVIGNLQLTPRAESPNALSSHSSLEMVKSAHLSNQVGVNRLLGSMNMSGPWSSASDSSTTVNIDNSGSGVTPWDMLWSVLRRENLTNYVANIEAASERLGLVILPPAVEFLMKHPIPKDDIRYDPDFIFPPLEICHFDASKPIARIVYNRTTLIVEESNLEADRIFGAQLHGKFIYSFLASLYEMWYSFIWFLPKYKTGVPVFKRARIRRRDDGKVAWILSRSILEGKSIGGRAIIDFQEILDLPPEVVNRPFLV